MPLFNFVCVNCDTHLRKILPVVEQQRCPLCNEWMIWGKGTDPTTRVVEVRDNGAMPRTVEQLEGIDEMVKDRDDGQT